jgi:hypothetical protein
MEETDRDSATNSNRWLNFQARLAIVLVAHSLNRQEGIAKCPK